MPSIEIPNNFVAQLTDIGLVPRDIVLHINSQCNLRCTYCYIGNHLLDQAFYYTTSSIINFIRDLPPLDRITVLGGEPLLHPGIKNIVEVIKNHSCKERRISTNLTILNEDYLSSLKENKFRICVSLDGQSPHQHDMVRGKGAFEKTTRNLKRAIKLGHDIEVTHTVSNKNIDSFWSFVNFCKSIGVNRLNLHRVSLRGNALTDRTLNVEPTQWRRFIKEIEAKSKQDPGNLRIRYEIGFVTSTEYAELLENKNYKHLSQHSYYSDTGGQRIVIYPNKKIYISSEAFGTDSYIGDIQNGYFKCNTSEKSELIISKKTEFNISSINNVFKGDNNYPIPLSVSYRRSAYI